MKKLRELLGSKKNSSGTQAKNDTQARSDAQAASKREISNRIGPEVLFDGAKEVNLGVDVVFVHGLRGSSHGTWSKGDFCWPRDLLREDMPNNRIITWGYDSNVANATTYASAESIYGHAETLLGDLCRIRQGITRPFIFVAHSLGGLVVKEALIKAAAYKNHGRHVARGEIYTMTKGVVFFGTPHRGSSKENLGEVVASISKFCLRQPNTQLLATLRKDSHILENQRDQFTTISKDIVVYCIREELPTAVGMIVEETSATYDGFNVIRGAIHGNHMDMVKFGQRHDPGYERAAGYLTELSETITQGERQEVRKFRKSLLRSLYFTTIEDRERRIHKAYTNTFSWALGTSETVDTPLVMTFQDWITSKRPAFWISGKAGSGKSTLLKWLHESSLVNELIGWSGTNSVTVASFFLQDRGDHLQKSREGMLRSLLLQILSANPTLAGDIYSSFNQTSSRFHTDVQVFKIYIDALNRNDWFTLRRLFEEVLSALQKTSTDLLLMIDGLDEYRIMDRLKHYTEEDLELIHDGANNDAAWGRSTWITDGHGEVATFIKSLMSRSHVKVCFSSRELPVFEAAFQEVPRMQVHLHTKPDIHRVCMGRLMEQAPNLSNISAFANAITEQSHGVFLWVRLVIDMLIQGYNNGDNTKELWTTLAKIPDRLGGKNGLYMLMIRNISADHKQESAAIFQLVLAALQPLHVLHIFSALESPETPMSELETPHKTQLSLKDYEQECRVKVLRLKSRCAGLLEASPEVQFMHQTAKEFMSYNYVWEAMFNKPREDETMNIYLALIRGSIRFLKSLALIDLNTVSKSDWLPEEGYDQTPLISIQSVMQHAAQVDRQHNHRELYFQLIDRFDETCNQLKSVLGDPLKTGAPRIEGFDSWIPQITPDTFLLWYNVHPPVPAFSPYFANFQEYSTQFDLAAYVDEKIRQLSPLVQAKAAQDLLAAAFGLYNYDNYAVLHANHRTVQVLLSHDADPDKVMFRQAKRNMFNNAYEKYTIWMDMVDANPHGWICKPVFAGEKVKRSMAKYRAQITWNDGINRLGEYFGSPLHESDTTWWKMALLLLKYTDEFTTEFLVFDKKGLLDEDEEKTEEAQLLTTPTLLRLMATKDIGVQANQALVLLKTQIIQEIESRFP